MGRFRLTAGFGLLQFLQQLDIVQKIVRRAQLGLFSLPLPERFECFLDLVVLGELVVFFMGRVDQLAKVEKCLMIGVAPIPDLGVDSLLRLGVGRLALELVEKIANLD